MVTLELIVEVICLLRYISCSFGLLLTLKKTIFWSLITVFSLGWEAQFSVPLSVVFTLYIALAAINGSSRQFTFTQKRIASTRKLVLFTIFLGCEIYGYRRDLASNNHSLETEQNFTHGAKAVLWSISSETPCKIISSVLRFIRSGTVTAATNLLRYNRVYKVIDLA